jgi:hypothetical protein
MGKIRDDKDSDSGMSVEDEKSLKKTVNKVKKIEKKKRTRKSRKIAVGRPLPS